MFFYLGLYHWLKNHVPHYSNNHASIFYIFQQFTFFFFCYIPLIWIIAI